MATYINGRKLVDAPKGFTHVLKTRPFKGKAYEYIVVAAKKLGRDIKETEVVHHRDKDHSNNSPENLLVLDSIATHAILHTHGCDESLLSALPDGSFTIDRDKIPKRVTNCTKCGKPIAVYSRTGICSVCASFKRRKASRPDKDELYKLVWTVPTTTIAKQFGVSDKAIDKWCKDAGISKPPRGYWSKLRSLPT